MKKKEDSGNPIAPEHQQREFIELSDGKKYPVAATVELSDGRIARIVKGKGWHALRAQELLASNLNKSNSSSSGDYFTIMFSLLVTVDNKFLAPQDFGDLDLTDFNKIQGEFGQINF